MTTNRKHELPAIGTMFGKLKLERIETGPLGGVKAVYVSCACSNHEHHYTADLHNLLLGKATQCRYCADKARMPKQYSSYTDVVPDTANRQRMLRRFASAINRCHNPNDKAYHRYGGRGIHVYEPWRADRSEFLRYIITLDGWNVPWYELDRIDNNKGYEPGNLRFVSAKVNNQNKRTVHQMQQRIDELEAELATLRGTA